MTRHAHTYTYTHTHTHVCVVVCILQSEAERAASFSIFVCLCVCVCVCVFDTGRERVCVYECACLSLSLSISISLLPLMSLPAHHSQIIFNNEWLLGINVNVEVPRTFCSGNDIPHLTSPYPDCCTASMPSPKKKGKRKIKKTEKKSH